MPGWRSLNPPSAPCSRAGPFFWAERADSPRPTPSPASASPHQNGDLPRSGSPMLIPPAHCPTANPVCCANCRTRRIGVEVASGHDGDGKSDLLSVVFGLRIVTTFSAFQKLSGRPELRSVRARRRLRRRAGRARHLHSRRDRPQAAGAARLYRPPRRGWSSAPAPGSGSIDGSVSDHAERLLVPRRNGYDPPR
jgi:hypothetical protein